MPPLHVRDMDDLLAVQVEVVQQQAKFDQTGSAQNSLWKLVGDKKTVEQVNLAPNNERRVVHQTPTRPRP